MESNQLTLGIRKNDTYGYELAYQLACEKLAGIKDIEEQCSRSGTRYLSSRKAVNISYLNQPYLLAFPDGRISLPDRENEVPLRDRILILHYFTGAKGTPLSNKLISFKELPEGANYFPTFYQRAVKPLVSYFGNEPHGLLPAAKVLGGHEASYGDAAVRINAFSRVPIILVLWRGDDEFAPEGNIMFDSTISDYLPAEDIIVLSETTARLCIKTAKASG